MPAVTRPRAPIPAESADHPLLRRGLVVGIVSSLLLVVWGFVRFPPLEGPLGRYLALAAAGGYRSPTSWVRISPCPIPTNPRWAAYAP